jgi:hypothetical protein
MKPELERELFEALHGPGDVGPVFGKIAEEYSRKISDALNPIGYVSAPFILLMLNEYAEMIAARYPDARKMSDILHAGMSSVEVTIPVKRSDPR